MKKIAVVSQKGGVSKSTLALCIAQCLAQNYKVCLVDTDPQGSLVNFKDLIKIDIVQEPVGYDVAIFDTPPYLSNKLPELMKEVDYVLIVSKPNYFDIVATKSIIGMIPKDKPAGIVITQVQHRVNISDVLEVLKGYNVPVLKQTMSHRVSYARAAIQSIFVTEDVKAQKEILSIVLEVFSQI